MSIQSIPQPERVQPATKPAASNSPSQMSTPLTPSERRLGASRQERYDAAVDGHCPEQAAAIAMEEYPCPCGVSEPGYAVERATATAEAPRTSHTCPHCPNPTDEELKPCEACQEQGMYWPKPGELSNATSRLSIGQTVCITNEQHFGRHVTILRLNKEAALVVWEETHRGAQIPRTASIPLTDLDIVRCLSCGGPHTLATCPEVKQERIRQEEEEATQAAQASSAGRDIQRAIEEDWSRFSLSLQHSTDSDRMALATMWSKEYGWQPEAILRAWLNKVAAAQQG